MKNLVRETTDLIDASAFEAALDSPAKTGLGGRMLGLSRQAFYVKLRRYGLGDGGDDSGTEQ